MTQREQFTVPQATLYQFTNRSVKNINPIEINAAASKAARMLGESGRAGYSEGGEVLTFDGDTSKKEVFAGVFYAVKLTDKYMDLNQVDSITIIAGDESGTFTKPNIAVSVDSGIQVLNYEALIFLTAVAENIPDIGVTKGVYVVLNEVEGLPCYATNVKFAETIHPIDPKFIPGVCLPVVELSTIITGGATFTDAENAALNEAAATGLPVVIKFDVELGIIICDVFTNGGSTALINYHFDIYLQSTDGVWSVENA